MDIYIIVLGGVLGFLAARFFAGKKAKEQGRVKSMKFHIGKYILHLHHWLIALAVLTALAALEIYDGLIYGLLAGVIIQGLTYKDFYQIFYQKEP